jgi:hypothetical protein
MFNDYDNTIEGSPLQRDSVSPALDFAADAGALHKKTTERVPRFNRVFRWRASGPEVPIPDSVQVAGSFTDWQSVAMTRDAVTNTWQLTLREIPGNQTHRYMLLVNGEPEYDKHCDGLAVPEGFEEQQYQFMTPRGPRIFLLFSQTK